MLESQIICVLFQVLLSPTGGRPAPTVPQYLQQQALKESSADGQTAESAPYPPAQVCSLLRCSLARLSSSYSHLRSVSHTSATFTCTSNLKLFTPQICFTHPSHANKAVPVRMLLWDSTQTAHAEALVLLRHVCKHGQVQRGLYVLNGSAPT